MEVGEMNKKEPQVEVPWIPTTPVKPILQKPVPICSPGEGNQLPHNANGAVACSEFTPAAEKNSMPYNGSPPEATMANIAGVSGGKTCAETAFDSGPPGFGHLSFSQLMFLQEAEAVSVNSNATQPGNNGLINPFIPSLKSQFQGDPVTNTANAVLSHHHLSLGSPIIQDKSRDPQGTSYIACWSGRTLQGSPSVPESVVRPESKQIASMQINMEEKNPGGKETNVPAEKLDNNGMPLNKELCDPVAEFAAVSTPLKENQSDKGSSHVIDLNKTPQQKQRRRKHRPKVITEGKPKRTRKPVAQKNVQPKENPTGKRKYVRKKGLNKISTTPAEETVELIKDLMPESVKRSCRRSLNFDIGARDECSAGRENATAHWGKDGVVLEEMNVGLAYDLTTSMKQASNNYMSLPEDIQAPSTSPSRRSPSGAKPKEKPTTKRRYVRKKALNNNSAPSTEVTGKLTKEMMCCRSSLSFDMEARDENSVGRENAAVHLSKEIGVVAQENNVGLACDLNTSMEQASNNNRPLPEKAQDPSKSNPPEAQPKEMPTGKRKNVRKKRLNKSSTPPTEMTGELNEPLMPKSNKRSRRRSLNFDIRARDESSAGGENLNVCISKENSVVAEEMHANLAYDQSTSMKQALNIYISLPVDAQAPSTSPSQADSPGTKPKEKPTGKRTYVRRKGLNKTSTPTAEMIGELTEALMPKSTKLSCTRSLNFDIGARDESSIRRENLNVHISKENSVLLKKTHVGLAYDQNTSMNQVLYNYMSLPEGTKAPSISPSKSNSTGGKLNANVNSVENKVKNNRNGQAAAQDGHENSANILLKSVAQSNPNGSVSQMVGSKRKHSVSPKHPDTSGMNLIGAQYNGLASYQAKCWVQFPNIQKKRRSEKGKGSSFYVTSSMTTTKEIQLTCPQEDAQGHPYASSSNCWIFNSECNVARVPAVESVIGNTQTFEEFILTLRRLTERSRTPTQICDCASLTRIGNCYTEPNYTAKQKGISDIQTFEDAERPLTCIDALVAETHASLTKKKRNKKKSALSSSADSSTSEMQQNHNLLLGNYYLPLDIAHEVISKTMHNVDALAEKFRQLDMNTEARNLALHEQNALVPYKQQNLKQNSLILEDGTIIPFQGPFDPIKKQHPRPKVDLDEETDRVWKLLMIDINSHGIDGTDEDKAKWWEEERNVFRGRADSFIARMHLVQGDRRFSRWKGSVVDSVVGVFLTQNVSDHLSSSAFMSLAARFPRKSSSTCKTYSGEGTSLVVKQPQVHIVEPEENTEWDVKTLNQSVYDQSSMTIDIAEHSAEKEAVNSNDSCRTTSSLTSLTDESNWRLSESSQRKTKEREEKSCYEGVRTELNDIVSSQSSVISSQISGDFSNDQHPEKIGSCSDSNSEIEDLSSTAKYTSIYNSTSSSNPLEMASSTKLHEVDSQRSKSTENLRDAYGQSIDLKNDNPTENLEKSNVTQVSLEASISPSLDYTLKLTPNSGVLGANCFDPFKTEASSSGFLKNEDENDKNRPCFQRTESAGQVVISHSQSMVAQVHPQGQSNHTQQNVFNISGQTQDPMQKETQLDLGDHKDAVRKEINEVSSTPMKLKSRGQGKEKKDNFNWDSLRIKAQAKAGKREKTENTMDSLDWDAVRRADVSEISDVIKERGMNNRLAERIKNFLNRLVEEHGDIDLEWLRDVPPDQAKEYLLSIRGLGLKSVECVRLLTLHHLAFPVDTNVGRIAVRLGWVPLQPLPESLQLHLLELYPVLESIQKYLWPRLCKLDQRTLYELHYQMITFGKVFCTKSKPNCNACPMRGECRHFASAFASARLALPGPEQRSIVSTSGNSATNQNPSVIASQLPLPLPENANQGAEIQQTEVSRHLESKSEINICQPIIEEPTTPEPECSQVSQNDMEDAFCEDSCEIPTIDLNIEEFTLNLQNYMQENMELQEGEMSKALVALTPEAASIPMPKLKNVSRLRTEHCVYELPDTHPLLEGWDTREPDDPGKYLLAIWTPGETANSIQAPESKCSSQECGQLCSEKECFSCNSFREANSQTVRGTLLIPCRTAMRGSFPLNGTYFQVNEVFADHESSLSPISVPRSLIWNLNRRTVYFGTSVPTIFKGLSTQEIQQCFWRGYVCVRGFDRATRAPRPLMARLHFPASKMPRTKENTRKKSTAAKSQGLKPNPEHPELLSNSHNLQRGIKPEDRPALFIP